MVGGLVVGGLGGGAATGAGADAEWLDGPGAGDGFEGVGAEPGVRGVVVVGTTLEVGGRPIAPGSEGADVRFGAVDGAVGEPFDRWLAGNVAAAPQAVATMAMAASAKTHDLRMDGLLTVVCRK